MFVKIGLFSALFLAASHLMAWTNYSDYDRSYSTVPWQYPAHFAEYQGGCPAASGQATPEAAPAQAPTPRAESRPRFEMQQAPAANKPLEQQFTDLIVMFTKEACPYCQYMKPIMQEVEAKFGDSIKFIYVDITQYPQTPNQYGFSTVPHIVYFKNGKQLDAHGSEDRTMTASQVEQKIQALGLGKPKTDA